MESSLTSKIILVGILLGFIASIVTWLIDYSRTYEKCFTNLMLLATIYCLIQVPIIQILSFWKLGFLRGIAIMLLLLLQLYIAIPGIELLAAFIAWSISGFAP
jgi:hypothetical protein